jgi:hypothetical protein
MLRRRLLVLGPIAGAIALAAPAVAHATPVSLAFPAGTVTVDDPGPSSSTVHFTMPNTPTTRAFIDIRGHGEAHIALGSPAALGVPYAVYTAQSTAGCQVFTGTAFGETDTVVGDRLVFDVRKDELAPNITIVLEDSAGGAPNCRGFDGSPGRPVTFDPANAVSGIQWQQPGDATNLRAIPGPHAITLAWRPPADSLGVKYEISELQPNGTFVAFDAVGGSSTTIDNLPPGVPHTYMLHAFRSWDGPWPSPNATGPATGIAAEFPAPAPAAGTTGVTVTVPKATPTTATKKASATAAKRAATPHAWKATARGRRVVITLPKLRKGQRFEIMRAAKAKYGRIATTTHRSYVDRKVRRGATYRYRLVLVSAAGARSLPSKTIVVRLPRS